MKAWLPFAAAAALFASSQSQASLLFTGPAGADAPFSQYQPSIALTQAVGIAGLFPSRTGDGPAAHLLGMVRTTAASFAPNGAPLARGQLLNLFGPPDENGERDRINTAPFSILGNRYGGDGVETFAVPDLGGRSIVGDSGPGGSSGASDYFLGQKVGQSTTVLTLDSMPEHTHGMAGGSFQSGPAGGNLPISNLQPSLALNYMIAVKGSDIISPGQIGVFAGDFAPAGWLFADGRQVSDSLYLDLFQKIGHTYGGVGRFFNLPDLRGRIAVGAGAGLALGTTFGSEEVVLTLDQLATHDHEHPYGVLNEGGGLPFDNAQPSLALNYLIATQGVFPSGSGNGALPEQFMLGEIVLSAATVVPEGFLRAEGQLLPIGPNQALFSLIGWTYGGSGTNQFALPDLRGRAVLGSTAQLGVGTLLGERFTALTEANLPSHVHGVPEPGTWLTLIVGFGLVGATLRRRRTAWSVA